MPRSPYKRSQPQRNEEPKSSGNSNPAAFWLGLVVVALGLFWFANQQGWIETKPDKEPDDVVIIDEDETPQDIDEPDKISSEGTYIVRVYESRNNPVWLTKQVRNDRFWLVGLAERGIGLHYFDPYDKDGNPNPQAASFIKAAEERGIDTKTTAFWVHAKGGRVLSMNPFVEFEDDNDGAKSVAHWNKIIASKTKD